MEIKLNFDGACWNEGKPPLMGIGVAVWVDGKYAEDLCVSECTGVGTNNVAEYGAVIEAIKVALKQVPREGRNVVMIQGDSQLIVNQLHGVYAVKKPHLKVLHRKALRLLDELKAIEGTVVTVSWVRREYNKEADKLSKLAISSISELKI